MSMELHIAMDRSRVPDVSALAFHSAERNLPFEFPDDFTLLAGSGFEPLKPLGRRSGVEIYRDENLGELFETYPVFQGLAGSLGFGISFRWGGYSQELATAIGLSIILVGDRGAVAYDPQEDISCALSVLQNEYDEAMREIRNSAEWPS